MGDEDHVAASSFEPGDITIPTEGRCQERWGPGNILRCGLRLPCPAHEPEED